MELIKGKRYQNKDTMRIVIFNGYVMGMASMRYEDNGALSRQHIAQVLFKFTEKILEMKVGVRVKGKVTKTVYTIYAISEGNKEVLLEYGEKLLNRVKFENFNHDLYEPYEEPEMVKVSIPERPYGVSVSQMLEVDFGSLEKRVIANMVRAHQMEQERKFLLSYAVSTTKEFNLINFLIPLVKKERVSGTVTGRLDGTITHAVNANKSDGSSADYYKLPSNATQLQDLISHKGMNAQMGEIFRAAYRYGQASHSDQLRDAKKIKYYIEAEIKRLENLND